MSYTEEAILDIEEKRQSTRQVYTELMIKLYELQQSVSNVKAREYLMEGVGRRLKTLIRCINNVFNIFPVDRNDLLTKDELADLSINLHAFVVNISGIFDNLAWIYVFENDLYGDPKEDKLTKFDIGLFNKKTQTRLWPNFTEYLNSETMQRWYKEYSKNYRDALAHRIPLYVPHLLH